MDLETLLQEKGIDYEKHMHAMAYTSQGLAHAEHVSGYMVAKPVIVKTATAYAMCVLPAPERLDLSKAAKALNEDEVRLATESEMLELFPDCELGAEPPVGLLFGMTTVMDPSLECDEWIVMQASSHDESITMRRDDWQRLCCPISAAIAAD